MSAVPSSHSSRSSAPSRAGHGHSITTKGGGGHNHAGSPKTVEGKVDAAHNKAAAARKTAEGKVDAARQKAETKIDAARKKAEALRDGCSLSADAKDSSPLGSTPNFGAWAGPDQKATKPAGAQPVASQGSASPAPAAAPAPSPTPAAPPAPVTPGPNGVIPESQRKGLEDQALQLAGAPVTPADESAINTIVQHESNWNANAVNNWDSNAKAGHPSQGLMQTIPSTFQANALPGYNSNIKDPLSNLVAGIRYADSRYGSLQNVPGVKDVAAGRPYVGY